MFRKISLFFLCYFFAFASFANESRTIRSTCNECQLTHIDATIEKALESFNVPGVAVGIVAEGKIIYVKGFGYCDQEKKFPVTTSTLFPIMSCTKAFTSFIIGQLVDEGLLHWDDRVVNYLPQFRLWDERTNEITIKDLLAHRSGLPRHDVVWYNSKPGRNDSEEDMTTFLQRLQYLEPVCPLREKYIYNNLMYHVLGQIIEKVMGIPWENVVKNRIFFPLGMQHSDCLSEHSHQLSNFAFPHAERREQHVPVPFLDISAIRAAGSIYSNINDMTKWVQLQISEGEFLGAQFLSKDTFNELHSLHISHDPRINGPEISFGYGLGWVIGKYRENKLVSHNGAMDGFYSNVALLPKQKIGVVVLGNSSFFQSLFPCAITNMIFDALLGYNDMDWITNNLDKWQSFKTHEKTKRKEKEAKRHLGTMPSHPLEDFAGEYEHPGYGTMKIVLKEGRLFANYYRLTVPLNHWEYDIFEVSDEAEDPVLTGKNFSFSQDSSGRIYKLYVPLEQPALPPILFERKHLQ